MEERSSKGKKKMRERIQRFMQGRYGSDELSKAMLVAMVVCAVLTWFTKGFLDTILTLAMWILLIYSYIRMFSRNHSKRWAENQKYLSFKNNIVGKMNREKNYAQQRKTHRIYTCPGCKQKIRVPKGKGKIEISCPKCRTKFVKRS